MNDVGRRVAVLRYCRLGRPPEREYLTTTAAPEEALVDQIAALRRHNWTPIDADTLVDGLAEPRILPPRSVLFTFDGGFRSMVDEALPVLRSYRCPYIVFVATSLVGTVASLDPDIDPPEQVLPWKELHTLASEGAAFGSIGVTNRPFEDLEPHEREEEIAESKRTLERKLGTTVRLFAWPFGRKGRRSDELKLRRAGYDAAFASRGEPFEPGDASIVWGVPRVSMSFDVDLNAILTENGDGE